MANIGMMGDDASNVLWMAMESGLAYVTWRSS
jgi:hypothetical protein